MAIFPATVIDDSGLPGVSNAGYEVVPSAADGIAVTPGNSWANGSYVEITSGIGAAIYVVGIVVGPASAAEGIEIDIATGGAGGETVISTLGYVQNAQTPAPGVIMLPATVAVAASTRIAARARRSASTHTIAGLKLIYVRQANLA